MKKLMLIFGAVLLGAMLTSSCKHNSLIDLTIHSISENCDPDTVYFQNDIYPMIVSNCAKSGCHNGSGGEEEAHDLSDYNAIMNSGYVKAFNANGSKIIDAVTSGGGEDKMPPSPNDPLSSSQIAMLKTWIDQGARNNECSGGCDTTSVSYSGTIAPLMDNYCTGCHGSTGNTTGIDLTSYSDHGSFSGVATVAANGRLYGSVTHQSGYVGMPEGADMLPDCKIDEIRIWIENGFPND